MADINLHKIFRHLTQDEKFLSTIIDNTNNKECKDTKSLDKKINTLTSKKFNMMSSMVTEYAPLVPHETQSYSSFPPSIKNYLTPDYIRVGIKNIIEKNMANVNVSFLNSLNILLRPNIYNADSNIKHSTNSIKQSNLVLDKHRDDYIRDLPLLEDFIRHRISRNFQINKTVKNTKKIQEINKEVVKNISEGKITHDIIQRIIDIFEVNLLVFDFITHDVTIYWTHGSKHPDLNVFKNIHCMAYVQGNYEPIILKNNYISKEHIRKMYIKILTDPTIKYHKEIKITIPTLIAINTWDNVTDPIFIDIMEKYINPLLESDREKCDMAEIK